MTKAEILAVVNELPDDKDISLLVYDGNDNWDAVHLFVDNFDGYDSADLVFQLDEAYMVTSGVDGMDDSLMLSHIVEDMELRQEFLGFSSENADVHLSDLVTTDSLAEIELFITCAKMTGRKFSKANIMSVINGHYPYLDGVDVVGLYEKVIELEVKHRYKKWDMKEEDILDCKFYPMTVEEAFIKYFKEYQTRLKFCNDDKHNIVDDDLRDQYHNWLDIGNYAKHGGDMH